MRISGPMGRDYGSKVQVCLPREHNSFIPLVHLSSCYPGRDIAKVCTTHTGDMVPWTVTLWKAEIGPLK